MFQLPTTAGGVISDFSGTQSAVRVFPGAPKSAVRRFQTIESHADAALDNFEQQQRLVEDVQNAKADRATYNSRGVGAVDPDEVARLEAAVERAENALKASQTLNGPAVAIGHAWRATRDSTLSFLSRNRSKELKVVPADVRKGSDPADLSGKLADLTIAISETQAAPMTEADALDRVRSRVESEAARGAPRAAMDLEMVGNPMRPSERMVLNFHFPTEPLAAMAFKEGELLSVFDGAAMMCFLAKDQVLAKLEADVRAFYAAWTGDVFTEAERRKRIADLKAERAMVERRLSQAIWDQIESGDDRAVFPSSLSPEAVLGVSVA